MPKSNHSQTKQCPGACGTLIDPRAKTCQSCRRNRRNEAAGAYAPEPDPLTPQLAESFKDNGNGTAEALTTTDENVRTLADLIRVCQIDLSVWDVERWVCNKWEVAAKLGDKGRETLQSRPLFQVKAWLKSKSAASLEARIIGEQILADIRETIAQAPAIYTHRQEQFVSEAGNFLFTFEPYDLHVGKNTWKKETVINYDIHTSEELFNAALDYQLDMALRLTRNGIDRILCVFGNDVSHIDNKMQTTTGGTFMDADSRYPRIYSHIVRMHRRAVEILKSVAPVDIKIVSGNHDEHTAYHLGMLLEAVYESDPRVTVDNNPHMRKYYEYGVNLFGLTHGVAEKVSELPLTMAREQPEMWARCPSREWHIGHLHKSEQWDAGKPGQQIQTLHSDKGVRVRRLTSMSGHDAWHTKNAYMDRRACQGFVYHRTAGFTAEVSFNIDHFSGKGLSL
jgi:hypothetical protein